MSELTRQRALRLAHQSARRFRTLRMSIREWADVEKIMRLQGHPWHEPLEPDDSRLDLWIDADRIRGGFWRTPPPRWRVETAVQTAVRNGSHWWLLNRADATVQSWKDAPEDAADLEDVYDPWFHFSDMSWLDRGRRGEIRLRGATAVAGREAFVLTLRGSAHARDRSMYRRFDILPECDRYVVSLDRERGVLLRAECYLGSDLLTVEEVTELEFDAPLAPSLFDEPRL